MIKNRKGWLRIVEAFTAVMLLAGVLLIIISNSRTNVYELSNQIYDSEEEILMKVYTNDSQRNIVLNIDLTTTPYLKWGEFAPANRMDEIKSKIEAETPGNLICKAKLCLIADACALGGDSPSEEKSIYVMSALIAANLSDYNPKKLNLFCWEK